MQPDIDRTPSPTPERLLEARLRERRRFLAFMGRAVASGTLLALGGVGGSALLGGLSGCSTSPSRRRTWDARTWNGSPLEPIRPSREDALVLAPGIQSRLLISWNEVIHPRGDRFGFNNDYTAWIPLGGTNAREALLWVNHEYPNPLFVSGYAKGKTRRKREQVIEEQLACGGSILKLERQGSAERPEWRWVYGDRYNRRITGRSEIPLVSDRPIRGKTTAIGTFANCAGGVTPWGTVLTCEENYDDFYSEAGKPSVFGWEEFFDYPVEHYGWVVEIAPRTGMARKLTALGRFAHEGATVTQASDGRAVVYLADDKNDEHLYKFVAAKVGDLARGTLYVANLAQGRWIPLTIESDARLKARFTDQTDLLVHTRQAAKLVGATELDRPEDVEVDPLTGDVYVALTNNVPKGRLHGSLLRVREAAADPLSLEFTSETYLAGGEETGFSCPDNLAFDPAGNLWMTSDRSSSFLNRGIHRDFGNNGLFLIPLRGPYAGEVMQMASAPVDSELTGMQFTPDGKTLFLSVQHPGEGSKSLEELTSHWPAGGDETPKPSVVTLSGPMLDAICVAQSTADRS